MESTPPKDHEDHITENGLNSQSHDNVVRKICSCASSDEKNPDAKAAVGQGMGEARKVGGVAFDQGEEQKGGFLEAQKEKRTVHTLLRSWTSGM